MSWQVTPSAPWKAVLLWNFLICLKQVKQKSEFLPLPSSEDVGSVGSNHSSPSWRMDCEDDSVYLAKTESILVALCTDTPSSATGNLRRGEIQFTQLILLHFTPCKSNCAFYLVLFIIVIFI